MNKEKWEWIDGWEGDYEVSNQGRVRSYKLDKISGRILSNVKTSSGYSQVSLRKDGKTYKKTVHSLVAAAFMGAKPISLEVNHIDGDKSNNNNNNLEYVTKSKNLMHAYKLGLIKPTCGERSGTVRLTEEDVIEIRNLKGKITQRKLSSMFGVSQSLISLIQTGKNWGHIT